ncbi:MAG: FAD-dependent oxidoreductase [Verrucomicrobiia bacterium]|jgi:fumarate reductase flavoprotein subunit
MPKDFDVIVVGAGGSGLAAAVSAAENGCRVLVLEKRPEPGGTTGIAVGSFTANGTAMQRRSQIEDSLDHHSEDAGKFAPGSIEERNNDSLRRFFLSHSAETLEWLREMGLSFHGPNPEPPNRVPRMHNVVPNAKAYITTLQSRLIMNGGELVCSAQVKALLTTDAGRVTGVEVVCQDGQTRKIHARRGVVLACGDYAGSHRLIAKHKGDRYGQINGINPHAAGEGHELAESVGARLLNMDVTYGPEVRFMPPTGKTFFQQLLATSGLMARLAGRLLPWVPKFVVTAYIKRLLVTWQHPENALFDDGAILLNCDGRRFCNEKSWPDREIAIADQPHKLAYLLLDERVAERYAKWPHFISTAPKIAYAYANDYLKLRPDIAVAADSVAALARSRELNAENMLKTVAEFNAVVRREMADPFGRTDDEHELSGSRWVLLGPACAYFTTTEGGAAIDESLRVLDQEGNSIEGLYAVGQTGLGGQILWGHGLHIGWALTSGRLVGKVLGRTRA